MNYQRNREYIIDKHKKYREDNKEHRNEIHKQYRQNNRDEINEQISCSICGCIISTRYVPNIKQPLNVNHLLNLLRTRTE